MSEHKVTVEQLDVYLEKYPKWSTSAVVTFINSYAVNSLRQDSFGYFRTHGDIVSSVTENNMLRDMLADGWIKKSAPDAGGISSFTLHPHANFVIEEWKRLRAQKKIEDEAAKLADKGVTFETRKVYLLLDMNGPEFLSSIIRLDDVGETWARSPLIVPTLEIAEKIAAASSLDLRIVECDVVATMPDKYISDTFGPRW